ncbi:MAG TPA: trehalose-phosphatase [Acidimicrobiales bacterium]|jgi:trehalose 6-phosphate phosphatase|nr:trehalose-phosphatase [Acidimicrobiales bacterium]
MDAPDGGGRQADDFWARLGESIRPFLADPERAAVLTDFDGTLAPIVDDPDQAVALPGAAEVLRRLVERYGAVGVVSGRPVSYLQERLPALPGVCLAGLYGLERSVADGEVEVHPEAAQWQEAVDEAATTADAEAPAGVRVERKGLAVTLHVRTAPQHAAWIGDFAQRQAAATGLQVHPGRRSVELRPPVDADKGTVVADLAAGWSAVCYLGDDRGDLPAFVCLERLRREGVTTLAVAVASAEAPAELLAAADLVVDGPAGALAVLEALAG